MISLRLATLCQISFVIYIATLNGNSCGDLPPEIEKCHAGDTKCIVKTMNEVIRRYPKGQPSFGLQPIDSVEVKDIEIAKAQRDNAVSLNLKFNTLQFKGLENATVERVVGFEKDPYNSKIEVYANVPSVSLSGQYEGDGKILLLTLKGKGLARIYLTNLKIGFKTKFDVQKRNGKNYVVIKKAKSTLQVEGLKVNFQNLFGENQELGQSINDVINENWRDLWNELKDGINNAATEVIKQLLAGVMNELSYDDIFKVD